MTHHAPADRDRYTVVAEPLEHDFWHLTVRELSATWTVAFARDDIEARARQRIVLDTDADPLDFEVVVVSPLGALRENVRDAERAVDDTTEGSAARRMAEKQAGNARDRYNDGVDDASRRYEGSELTG